MAIQNGLQKNIIQGNVFLTITAEKQFSLTAFKIMQNDVTGMFIKCIKTRHNGSIELVYVTEGYVSLRELAFKMDIKKLTAILLNTLKKAKALSEYGFLNMDYLELAPSDIYVDEKTLDTKFIYMPVQNFEMQGGRSGYLYRLKTGFIGLFQVVSGKEDRAYFNETITRLLMDATAGSDDLIARISALINDIPAKREEKTEKKDAGAT